VYYFVKTLCLSLFCILDQFNNFHRKVPVLLHHSYSFPAIPTRPPAQDGRRARRRWTAGELAEIIAALASLRTADIARAIDVNPKALRAVLRRHGISLRGLREQAKKPECREGSGLLVRRSMIAPSAAHGAAALVALPDNACRWPSGDPAEADFAFCAAPRLRLKPYCSVHMRLSRERTYDPQE
jgi:GcrA cell cycle regulator